MDVALVAPGEGDAALWMRWRGEAATRRHNPLAPSTEPEIADRLRASTTDLHDPDASEFRWMVRAGGETVGTVAAFRYSRAMGTIEIGYMIGEAHQGKGYGTRSVALLVEKLFAAGLRRVIAIVSVDNEPSVRLLETLGFKQEGRLREHYLIEGRPVDQLIFGRLRSES